MTDVTAQDLGQKIRLHRQRLDMTQQELADASSVTRAYITMLEGGSNYPSLVVARRIAGALDVALEELMEADHD